MSLTDASLPPFVDNNRTVTLPIVRSPDTVYAAIIKILHRQILDIIRLLPKLTRLSGLVEFNDEVVRTANGHTTLEQVYVETASWDRSLDDDFFDTIGFKLAAPSPESASVAPTTLPATLSPSTNESTHTHHSHLPTLHKFTTSISGDFPYFRSQNKLGCTALRMGLSFDIFQVDFRHELFTRQVNPDSDHMRLLRESVCSGKVRRLWLRVDGSRRRKEEESAVVQEVVGILNAGLQIAESGKDGGGAVLLEEIILQDISSLQTVLSFMNRFNRMSNADGRADPRLEMLAICFHKIVLRRKSALANTLQRYDVSRLLSLLATVIFSTFA